MRFLLGAYAYGELVTWEKCNGASLDIHPLMGEARRRGYDMAALAACVGKWRRAMTESVGLAPEAYVKTHFKWTDDHPMREYTHKVIHVLRHPKDVLLSSVNYLQLRGRDIGTERRAAWDFVGRGGMPLWLDAMGSWFEHYQCLASDAGYPTLLVRYEDLRRDAPAEFARVIRFLDVPLDEERVRRAVVDASIDRVRDLEGKFRAENDTPQFKDGFRLVREGKTCQTLQHLDPALDAAFDETFAPYLRATGYL